MKKLLPFFIFIFALSAVAQDRIATTEDGKKVLLKSDKTWDYVKNDSITPVASQGDCSAFIQITKDRMTDQVITSGKKTVIVSSDGGKTGFGIILLIGGESLIISIQAVERGSGCMDAGGDIAILFTDGSKMSLSNQSKFNCEGRATIYVGGGFGNEKAEEVFATKKIQAIRVSTVKSFIERDLTNEQATEILNQFACLKKSLKKSQ